MHGPAPPACGRPSSCRSAGVGGQDRSFGVGMDRLERLINLAAELLAADRALTRDELRERLGVYPTDDASFRRAFERDKEALRSMGMPLVTERVDARDPDSTEGYRI